MIERLHKRWFRVRLWFARGHRWRTRWGGVSWFSRWMGVAFNEGGRWLCVVVKWDHPFFYVSLWNRWFCPRAWFGWDHEARRLYGGATVRPDYAGKVA